MADSTSCSLLRWHLSKLTISFSNNRITSSRSSWQLQRRNILKHYWTLKSCYGSWNHVYFKKLSIFLDLTLSTFYSLPIRWPERSSRQYVLLIFYLLHLFQSVQFTFHVCNLQGLDWELHISVCLQEAELFPSLYHLRFYHVQLLLQTCTYKIVSWNVLLQFGVVCFCFTNNSYSSSYTTWPKVPGYPNM